MNQNTFCSKCHRIPSQCCCGSVKELTDEEILEAQKLFSNMHKNATESWGSLDLNNQSNLECARAWFIEGFAHGQKLKELTDDKIADLIKATNDEIGMKNIRTFDFTKVLLRKAQEK